MGMFGPKRGADYPGTPPYMPDQRTPEGARPSYDDVGGLHDKLSRLSAHLMSAGGNQAGASSVLDELSGRQKAFDDYQRQVAIARFKAQNPDPTAIQQNAAAGGLVPGTPAYQKWVLDNGGRPANYFMMGSPESGQQIVSPNAPAPAQTPPPPQPGTIVQGHRFLGGDPSLPTSWQQVQ